MQTKETLEKFLRWASSEYYSGSPVIPDEVFDRLAESVGWNSVGAKQHEHIEKHAWPMYSLQKYYEGEGKPITLPGTDIDTSPKLDGAAISHLYIYGELVRTLTRGDGVEGTNVTDKFLATKLVPHFVQEFSSIELVQVTGELAAPKHVQNARNYAAGALNLKDVNEFKVKSLTFFAYGVQPPITNSFKQDMEELSKIGFNTVKDPEIHNIYPCDGVVHRLDKYDEFFAAGYTSKHPKGAYALKERGTSVETKLLDVSWQTGKTGKVTPVAILEPVMIGDALVSRATLNNIAFIRALELKIGDIVGVIRSGEIIPCVTHRVA